MSVYGIAKDFGRPQLRDVIGQLEARGLLVRSEGQYPTLAVTTEGREFLRERQTISLFAPADASGAKASRSDSPPTVEYDENLFEDLRTLRKRLADAQAVPPYVVFGDVSLRHMAAAYPQSMEEFSQISGVGRLKLEQYGPEFLKAIGDYVEVNGLPERRNTVPASLEPIKRQGSTYEATRELLSQGLSVNQIAQQRGLEEKTIIGHLERVADQGVSLNLEHLMPSAERLQSIEEAFDVCGSAFLRPVREFLGTEFNYDELRLARIHLRQEGRLPDDRPE